MLFQLINTPALFWRFINKVYREHLDIFVISYHDDILIFSKDYDERVEHIKKVLTFEKD